MTDRNGGSEAKGNPSFSSGLSIALVPPLPTAGK